MLKIDIAKLEHKLHNVSRAISEVDDELSDIQQNFILSGNMADIQRRRILEQVNSNVSNLSETAGKIGEQIEQIKCFGYMS